MANRLVNLFVKNVAAVDKAANKRTFLVIKSATSKSDEAMSFDDAMFGRQLHEVYCAVGERYGALMETIDSIRRSDESDKVAAVKKAIGDFVESMAGAIPGLLNDLSKADLQKSGRKISSERMEKLKTLMKTLTDIINEQEGEAMSETKKADLGALQKMATGIAAMFARATGADEKDIQALEKAASGEPAPPVVPAEVTAQIAKAEADNRALTERLEKAEKETQKLRDEAELRKFAEEVSGFKSIGLDPAKDAELFKSVTEKLPKEQADRFREIFKAIAAQANVSKMFGEVGSSGNGATADSAAALVEQRVNDHMSKNTTTSRADATTAVFKADPALYERYRNETTVKI